MEIVAGTYEELLIGYKIVESNGEYKLDSSFNDHSHSGSVRCVAVSDKGILASGSTDESIRLFNMRTRVELGSLMHHQGTVTGLCYHGRQHMVSSSDDGTIGVWKTGSWECMRTLRGHRGAVVDVAVHPSGKLALSIGKDKTLRTWNLMTGKAAYVTNMKQVCDIVRWSPKGDTYIVVCNNTVDVYSVETAQICHSIKCDFRVNSVEFLQARVLVVGGEGGLVELHDLSTQDKLLQLHTDTNRVKGMCCCASTPDGSTSWLITASSDGFVKLWRIKVKQGDWSTQLLAEVNSTFRLTCVALVPPRPQTDGTQRHTTCSTEHQDSLPNPAQTHSATSMDSHKHTQDAVVKRKQKRKGKQKTAAHGTSVQATKKHKHK